MAIRFPSKNSKNKEQREMAQWIDEQCQAYRNGTLSQEQIEKLECVPGWSWDRDSGEPDDEVKE